MLQQNWTANSTQHLPEQSLAEPPPRDPKQRQLTTEQKKFLSNAIIDNKVDMSGFQIIFSAHGGAESREYAEDLANVFQEQGWDGATHVPNDDDPHLTGLKLWYQPENGKDDNAAKVAAALDAAGIDYGWIPHGPPYSGAILFVYRKP